MENIFSVSQILDLYKRGQRNFDGVRCIGQDFHGFLLKAATFHKANLSSSSFDTADLSDCDFTGANLMWASFRKANLSKTKFVKANVSYCDFDGAIFDKTDFTGADLTASLLFNTNIGAANLGGANMTWAATHISQLSEEGFRFVMEQLKRMGRAIPPEIMSQLQVVVIKLHESKRQLEQLKASFGYGRGAGPGDSSAYNAQINRLEGEIAGLYNSFSGLYGQAVKYTTGGKAKPKGKFSDLYK
jgi:hypothetical protein